MIGAPEGVEELRRLCRDSAGAVREAAIDSLDFVFPDASKPLFLELASDAEYEARGRVVNCLGRYRYPEVRILLKDLCADPDQDVRDEAVESLRRLDQRLSDELRYTRRVGGGSRILRLAMFVARKLKLPDYMRLVREIRLAGKTQQEAFAEAQRRIFEDSELKREFRPLILLVVATFVPLFLAGPGVLIAGLSRGFLSAGSALWSVKWVSLGVVVAAACTLLPWVRRGRDKKYIWVLVVAARFLGPAVLIVWTGYAAVRWWWVSLPLAILGALLAARVIGRQIGGRPRLGPGLEITSIGRSSPPSA